MRPGLFVATRRPDSLTGVPTSPDSWRRRFFKALLPVILALLVFAGPYLSRVTPVNAATNASTTSTTGVSGGGAIQLTPLAPGRDLNGDGLIEDVNGNSRFDFDDVVTLFELLDTPAVQENSGLFDFNANGRVDMDDVVKLFDMLIA